MKYLITIRLIPPHITNSQSNLLLGYQRQSSSEVNNVQLVVGDPLKYLLFIFYHFLIDEPKRNAQKNE